MSFVYKNATKLSQLAIDIEKDWNAMGIDNIAQVTAGMQEGDLVYYNGTQIVISRPGNIGTKLTTQGAGANPIWSP